MISNYWRGRGGGPLMISICWRGQGRDGGSLRFPLAGEGDVVVHYGSHLLARARWLSAMISNAGEGDAVVHYGSHLLARARRLSATISTGWLGRGGGSL